MSVNGIGVGYPAWREAGKSQRNNLKTGFADSMVNAALTGSSSFQGSSARTSVQTSVLEAYRASAASTVHNVKQTYETYESENYKIVPDNEAGCFDIYNKQGEKLGVFSYSDIKVRQDSATGKQFLISEHGTMSYDVMVLDGEMKEALQSVMGVETLETVELQGFTLKTHSGTGIQYLVRDGEEGRGGKVLLQSEADIKKYETLAQTYLNKYPNLIESKEEAYIWADLEIKGLAQHTNNGIISMGYDGMSYNDNSDDKNNWSVRFSGDTYKLIFDWVQSHRESIEEMQKFSTWQKVFKAENDGTVRFDRELAKAAYSTQPSFGTAMTREELYQFIDVELEKNKKLYGKTEAEWIKEQCPNWQTTKFKFVGDSKLYNYYEFLKELNKR